MMAEFFPRFRFSVQDVFVISGGWLLEVEVGFTFGFWIFWEL